MRLQTLLGALDTLQTNSPDLDLEITGIHNDTRHMQRGDLFVAISGASMDGHDYIDAALAAGAPLIVSERKLADEVPHVIVPDTKVALAQLAACFYEYPARRMTMVGVTGTNGKTTVTHILKNIIDAAEGQKCGLIGTSGITIGAKHLPSDRTTPDAVSLQATFAEMASSGCTHCVMEVSSHALAQHRVYGIPYRVGVFTNLRHDHLDYHKTVHEYFECKTRLFAQSDIAVVNADEEYGRQLQMQLGVGALSYSRQRDNADVVARNIKLLPAAVEFEAVTRSQVARVRWNTPGLFSVENALAAVTTGLVLGIPIECIAGAVADTRPVRGRLERVPTPGNFTVMLDYAHTADALENILSTMRAVKRGRLLTVFGCGGDRDKSKRPLMGEVADRLSDVCFVTTDNPRTEDPGAIIDDILAGMRRKPRVIPDRREAIHAALAEAADGDVVLLCGKGDETYQEIHGVKYPMDEREIVAAFWGEEHD